MQSITMTPIGTVRNQIGAKKEDFWGDSESTIELDPTCFTPEALAGLSEFSHIEVLFHFHNFPEERIVRSQRHPHENPNWPRVGIFAQRGKARPNRIGATICRLLNIDGLRVRVSGLDAFDGTPVLDLKPVMAEFVPEKRAICQPAWSRELMASYFAVQKPPTGRN